jgi:AcrR family transcriptional regulator
MARSGRQQTQTAGTSPTAHAPGEVRRAVLDAAIDIIRTDGPDQVSMREVARRAGVSHQAPYHHFVDRSGIFAAISEEGYRLFTRDFRSTATTSTDVLAEMLRAYVRFALAHQGHFKVMFRADICGVQTHDATREAADEAYLTLLDLAARVDPHSTSGALALPTLLWSQAHGLATLLIDGPLARKLPPEVSVETLVDSVAELASRQIAALIQPR